MSIDYRGRINDNGYHIDMILYTTKLTTDNLSQIVEMIRLNNKALKQQQAEIEKLKKASDWISVDDKLPRKNQAVLAAQNTNEHNTIITANYICQHQKELNMSFDEVDSEYDKENDIFYWKQGWYETVNNWDDYTALTLMRGEVTHWQPLPKPPETKSK